LALATAHKRLAPASVVVIIGALKYGTETIRTEVINDDYFDDDNDDGDYNNHHRLSSPNIIRVVKSRRVRLAVHVARMVGE